MQRIFEKLTVGSHVLKNRIVVPPLVVFGLPNDGSDMVRQAQIDHYREMAAGGPGLLIVESITTYETHEDRAMIGAYDEKFLPGLTKLAEACKENDTVALAQITNTGLELMPYMTLAEMPAEQFVFLRDRFVKAALICKKAGFDGVEIHCAHGFYMNQVLELNNRTDEYGDGNAVLAGMIREIKEKCGKDFLVDVRLGNHDMDELIRSAQAAEEAGADLVHISRGAWADGDASLSKHDPKAELLHSPQPSEPLPADFGYEYTVYCASRVKPHVHIPVICVGGIRRAEEAADILKRGIADLVALGRQSLADPEWVNKIMSGKTPEYCRQCRFCQWMNDGTGSRCPARIIAARNAEEAEEK